MLSPAALSSPVLSPFDVSPLAQLTIPTESVIAANAPMLAVIERFENCLFALLKPEAPKEETPSTLWSQ